MMLMKRLFHLQPELKIVTDIGDKLERKAKRGSSSTDAVTGARENLKEDKRE